MKNKYKMILFGVLCVIFLQTSLTVSAVTDHDFELPLDSLPEIESTVESTSTTDKSDTEEKSTPSGKAESSVIHYIELPVITPDGELVETSKTTSSADNEPSHVSEIGIVSQSSNNSLSSKISSNSQSSNNSLSSEIGIVSQSSDNSLSSKISSDSKGADESVLSENSSDTQKSDDSLSEENNSSREQAAAPAENSERPESNGSNLPIIIAAICGAIVIVAGVLFVIIRKAKK